MKTHHPLIAAAAFGLIAALAWVPGTMVLTGLAGPWVGPRLAWWALLAAYGLWLARQAGRGPATLASPIAALLFSVFWAVSDPAFFILAGLALSWMRTGLCFGVTLPRLVWEEILVWGGLAAVWFFAPYGPLAQALSLWVFLLVQSLYFLGWEKGEPAGAIAVDSFEQARRNAESILETA